jgi:hypothetical protein
MAIINKSEPNNFEGRLQPDPMLRTGRARLPMIWIIVGAIAIVLVITSFGMFSGNHHTLLNAKNSLIGDPPLPDGMSKRGQGALLDDRTPLAPPSSR